MTAYIAFLTDTGIAQAIPVVRDGGGWRLDPRHHSDPGEELPLVTAKVHETPTGAIEEARARHRMQTHPLLIAIAAEIDRLGRRMRARGPLGLTRADLDALQKVADDFERARSTIVK